VKLSLVIIAHVSAVATNGKTYRSIPLMTERQESPPKIEGTNKPDGDTIVTQMVDLVAKAAKSFDGEKAVVALDAYFAKASAFEAAAKAVTDNGERILEIVTRAPSDTVAFTVPEISDKKGRGRPREYGNKIKLYDLFSDTSNFTETTMLLYGKKCQVKYLCIDLIWKPTKTKGLGLVRFVLVELNGKDRLVLMSSSLELTAEEIITIYGLRFKIEGSFDEQKNDMGCFSYHFWTKAMEKRPRKKKAEKPTDDKSLELAKNTERAIESYICLGTIATGIITIIAFTHNRQIWKRYPGWIKTIRSDIPSIAITKETLANDLPIFLRLFPHVPICSIINYRRRNDESSFDDVA